MNLSDLVVEDAVPLGYVPTEADFVQFAETMAAETGSYPDLALVDGELVHGRKVGADGFAVRPEEGQVMRETKRERLRGQEVYDRGGRGPQALF